MISLINIFSFTFFTKIIKFCVRYYHNDVWYSMPWYRQLQAKVTKIKINDFFFRNQVAEKLIFLLTKFQRIIGLQLMVSGIAS